MIFLLKYNNKTNICFFNGRFTFSVFILWFWLFCRFCVLISVGVIWFVIWWVFGFLLRFDFGWVLTVVVVVIWFWLGFSSDAWLEVMSLKSSGHGGLEGELGDQPWSSVWRGLRQREDEREIGMALDILGPKVRTKNWAFFYTYMLIKLMFI